MPLPNLPNFEPTVWEQKLRAYRLRNETPEVRAWREEAEAPNTIGERLVEIARAVRDDNRKTKQYMNGLSVLKAVARHPNTPPGALLTLLLQCADAFCENPIAPFILFEMPDFCGRVEERGWPLLRQENAPVVLVRSLLHATANPKDIQRSLRESAALHISVAGEVRSIQEGEAQITDFWQRYVSRLLSELAENELDDDAPKRRIRREQLNQTLHPISEMAELGFAPTWTSDPRFFIEPRIPILSPEAVQWLSGGVVPNSVAEIKLWGKIAPGLARHYELAAHVRPTADEEDLATLASIVDSQTGCLHEIIAAHPNATYEVMERLLQVQMAREDGLLYIDQALRLLATHPSTSTEFLTQLLQKGEAEIRRLARRHANSPAKAKEAARRVVVERWACPRTHASSFTQLIAGLQGNLPIDFLFSYGSERPSHRLTAALCLPVEPVRFSIKPERDAMKAGCTTRDLLEHLARDGNRLVRWAAQTRLQNPGYVFRWAEPEQSL